MIKVNLDGTPYVLDFIYENEVFTGTRATTALLIEDNVDDRKNRYARYFTTVYKHPKDRDVKENARKAAIRRLVRSFSKEDRTAVWKAYFARK